MSISPSFVPGYPSLPSGLVRVTLTGVDEQTDLGRLVAIAQEHPHVEWGVLWGGASTPRYPSLNFLERCAVLKSDHNLAMALHLCGKHARNWLAGDPAAHALALQFTRIQLNIVASRLNVEDVVGAITSSQHPAIITQHHSGNASITSALASCHQHAVLFDGSGGRGQSPDAWPATLQGHLCGYAGGLGPDNVASEIPAIHAAAEGERKPYWIDMENKIRTPEDLFDLDACVQVLSCIPRQLLASSSGKTITQTQLDALQDQGSWDSEPSAAPPANRHP